MNSKIKDSYKILISGRVQGVGFRPFVYKISHQLNLYGEIYNDGKGVVVLINATKDEFENFKNQLFCQLPPLARIDSFDAKITTTRNFDEFKIIASKNSEKFTPILPDFAICDDCIKEFHNPKNHRYHYAFINCTNCGPRLSIIKKLPYDRKNTTMDVFEKCEICESEYQNPLDRRYHAQPISCKNCGPNIYFKNISGEILATENNAITKLCESLKAGKIVAVKSTGGFHIMCDATNQASVSLLRKRKNRPRKPFAIMCKNFKQASQIAKISAQEQMLLNSQIKPIVILNRKKNINILASNIAPNIDKIGIFLPNWGLQLLIFEQIDFPLIATSANISGEPIIHDEINLKNKLKNIVDFYLDFNREIFSPSDDSVAFSIENEIKNFSTSKQNMQNNLQNFMYLRTSRAINPQIFKSEFQIKGTFLAIGAELKNQFAIYKDGQIFISPYIGDLKNVATFDRFLALLEIFKTTYELKFDAVIADLHPNFLHTKYFENLGFKIIRYQHHFSHLVSNLAQNLCLSSGKKFLGFCFDGTGYGDDGKIWGGEIMEFDEFSYKRVAKFREFSLLSGENSIKNIYKLAISLIFEFNIEDEAKYYLTKFQPTEISNLKKIFNANRAPKTTSLGRIFDAFAAVILDEMDVSFDGEAGMRLEALYDENITEAYKFVCENGVIDFSDAFKNIFTDKAKVATTKFFNGLANFILDFSIKFFENRNFNDKIVFLSGGVFQNATLLKIIINKFKKTSIKIHLNTTTPTNDSGIAYGQLNAYLCELRRKKWIM